MMFDVQLKLINNGEGAFFITDNGKQVGEMVISVRGTKLTVYHTEVAAEVEGQGLAKKLLSAMVDYARQNQLKVIPLCPYVHLQFRRHPRNYADLWQAEKVQE